MANKDFLSQFSTNNKPDSFKEEERIPVVKDKKPINPKIIIIGVISLVVVLALIIIIFFIPKIKVESFVGLKKEDAVAWIRQQGIETSGIIFKEEYDFDNEVGVVLSQDPESGKVNNKAKMTFVISKGPDPDEKIIVPDFKTMDKDTINAWIKENKLSSTRINSTYSDTVEENEFIEAKYSGCDEDTFTRSCTLKISVSKGAKPEDQILMQDFVKKTYVEFETWATAKKLKIEKTESYSDTVEAGTVISQSVKENEKVKAGDTIKVVVSKGKGVKVPDFTLMSESKIDEWIKENSTYVKYDEVYSYESGYVIYQSAKTGTYIGTDNKLQLTLNLGDTFYLADVNLSASGSYDKFVDLARELEEKGLEIEVHDTYEESSTSKGTVLDIIDIYDESGRHYSKSERLPINVDIRCSVSDGLMITIPSSEYSDKPLKDFYNNFINELKVNYQPTLVDYDTGKVIKESSLGSIDKKIQDLYYLNDPISKVNGLIQGGKATKLSVKVDGEIEEADLENISPASDDE